MCFVSIIVPVYGVERYVERCLRSVMVQDTDIGIECLIVNDGSNDGSVDVINELLADYDGAVEFRIIHHNENLGLSAARNSGIAEAKGEYLLFLDADDELTSDSLRLFAEAVKRQPNVDMVVGEYANARTHHGVSSREATLPCSVNSIGKCYKTKQHRIVEDAPWCVHTKFTMIKSLLLHEDIIPDTAHNKLTRRKLIEKNHLIFHPGIIHEDNLWEWHLAKNVKSLLLLPTPTMIYHSTPGSLSNTLTLRHLQSLCVIIEEKIDTIDSICREEQLCNILHTVHQMEYRSRQLGCPEMKSHIKTYIAQLRKEPQTQHFALSLSLLRLKMATTLSHDNFLYRLLHRLSLRLVR
ncbi:MAG: glycosyltransferase [Muribaculum sp.]|nr:glycosyltransferase [Muribaculum sp.]